MAFDATISPGDPGHIETHEDIAALLIPVDDVSFKVAGVEQGLLSAIPAAGSTYTRFVYFATDTDDLYYCDGVVWNNVSGIDATILDVKGDLIVASAADTPLRLAAGTNGYALVADSTAGVGLAYADVKPTTHACRVNKSGTQSLSDATATVITFDTEDFDTDAIHSTVSNTGRLTIPAGFGGRWMLTAQIAFTGDADGLRQAYIAKNGSGANDTGAIFVMTAAAGQGAGSDTFVAISTVVAGVAGDYYELIGTHNAGNALNVAATRTWFQAVFLG